jgi:hypothetical protein
MWDGVLGSAPSSRTPKDDMLAKAGGALGHMVSKLEFRWCDGPGTALRYPRCCSVENLNSWSKLIWSSQGILVIVWIPKRKNSSCVRRLVRAAARGLETYHKDENGTLRSTSAFDNVIFSYFEPALSGFNCIFTDPLDILVSLSSQRRAENSMKSSLPLGKKIEPGIIKTMCMLAILNFRWCCKAHCYFDFF